MKWSEKFFKWCCMKLPAIWGLIWVLIITGASLSILIIVLKWLFQLLF